MQQKKNKTTQQPNNREGGRAGRTGAEGPEREGNNSVSEAEVAGPSWGTAAARRPEASPQPAGTGALPGRPHTALPVLPAPARRTGVGKGGRLCAERGRRCPLPPGPRALTSPLPRQHCFSAPRRSSPLAASRAAWGGPGRGQRSEAMAAGRAQSALSSPPPPRPSPAPPPPPPGEASALRGAARRGSRRHRSVSAARSP